MLSPSRRLTNHLALPTQRLTQVIDILERSYQLSEPFCQPYGNRRLLHCVPSSLPHHPPSKSSSSSHNSGGGSSSSSEQHSQEIPAWEACGKSPSKELKDYWEFVVRAAVSSSYL